MQRLVYALALLAALNLAVAPMAQAQEVQPTLPIPAALPQHFGIGLAAHPDDSGLNGWMPQSDVPWDYAYQYLAGGVNTGNGWRTWNSDGQFPLFYAHGAAASGALAVFPYYMLLQSDGPCGDCGEAERDLANLDDAAAMAAYYDDFAALMKRLGPGSHDGIAGFGGPAIVHVEPDLSGYAMQAVLDNSRCFGHCDGQGNDPALLRAAVARSGNPDVAGYPDTFQGFNWALLHLRDLYAPNVLLAFHVSNWATLQDVGRSTDPALDVAALGDQAGTFARLSGAGQAPDGTSTYDLLFNDVADRDAGFRQHVFGDPGSWWDRLNQTFPNFHRWEQYLGAAVRATGRPVMVWQIPLGNQRLASMDNSDGHYQDNRAEYFFQHIDELAQIGIIGLLFGRGNAGSTTNHDDRGDGVTNSSPFCATEGASSGQVCNDQPSDYPDDDGGYLRLAGQAYYTAGPLPLDGTALAPPATPSADGTPATPPAEPAAELVVTLGASASDPLAAPAGQDVYVYQSFTVSRDATLLVDFELYDSANVEARVGEPVAVSATYTVANDLPPGDYTFKVGIFAPDWSSMYVWNNDAGRLSVQ